MLCTLCRMLSMLLRQWLLLLLLPCCLAALWMAPGLAPQHQDVHTKGL